MRRISRLNKLVGSKRSFCGLSGQSTGFRGNNPIPRIQSFATPRMQEIKLPSEMDNDELVDYFREQCELDPNDDIADEPDEDVPSEFLDYWHGKDNVAPRDYTSHVNQWKLPFDLDEKLGQTYFVSCNPYKDEDQNKNIFSHTFAIMQNAKSSIYVSTLNFSDYYGATMLIDAIRRGVDVNLVIDGTKTGTKLWQKCYGALKLASHSTDSKRGKLKETFSYGLKGGFSHNKCVAADNKWAVSSSANFSQYSRLRNYEAGFFTAQPETVKEIIDFFDEHW